METDTVALENGVIVSAAVQTEPRHQVDAPDPAGQLAEDNARFARVWQLFNYSVLDSRGDTVGPVYEVWADDTTGSMKFVGVRTGRFWRRTRVIPARDAQIDDKTCSIRVKYLADRIWGAPSHNTAVSLNVQQERTVDTYYASL